MGGGGTSSLTSSGHSEPGRSHGTEMMLGVRSLLAVARNPARPPATAIGDSPKVTFQPVLVTRGGVCRQVFPCARVGGDVIQLFFKVRISPVSSDLALQMCAELFPHCILSNRK